MTGDEKSQCAFTKIPLKPKGSAEPINLEVIGTATIQETLFGTTQAVTRSTARRLLNISGIDQLAIMSPVRVQPTIGAGRFHRTGSKASSGIPAHPLLPPHQLAVPSWQQTSLSPVPAVSICTTLPPNEFHCDPAIVPSTQEPGARVFVR